MISNENSRTISPASNKWRTCIAMMFSGSGKKRLGYKMIWATYTSHTLRINNRSFRRNRNRKPWKSSSICRWFENRWRMINDVNKNAEMNSIDNRTRCSTIKNRKETRHDRLRWKKNSVIRCELRNIEETKSKRKETIETFTTVLMIVMPVRLTSMLRLLCCQKMPKVLTWIHGFVRMKKTTTVVRLKKRRWRDKSVILIFKILKTLFFSKCRKRKIKSDVKERLINAK